MRPVAPVSVDLRPSRYLLVMLALAHVLAAFALLASNIPGSLIGIGLLAVGGSWSHSRGIKVPPGLVLQGDGRLRKVGAGDTALEPHESSCVLGALIVLCYREDQALRYLILLPDSFLRADDIRKLRRWINWQARYRVFKLSA